MAHRPGLRAAFGVLLVACAASSVAGRALLEHTAIPARTAEERRMLIDTVDLVLGLDASEADAGAELPLLVGSLGEATWTSTDNPAMSARMYNAGYDTAYGGSAVFTAPAAGAAGTYAVTGELLGVTDSAWGDEFTAVAWYKASGSVDSEAVLLQVAYASDLGDWGSSATWRVGGFSDKSQGFVRLQGFEAAAPWTVGPDCWQQLAVVKAGNQLTFYYNKDAAGNSTAAVVINDYGTSALVLGVDYALLGGGNATTIDPTQLAKTGLGWLGGSLGMLAVYSRALDATAIGAVYDEQQAGNRFSEALCTRVPVTSISPAPAPAPSVAPTPAPSPAPSPSPSPSPPTANPAASPPPTADPAASPPPPTTTTTPVAGLNPPPPTDGGSGGGGGGFPWQQSPPPSTVQVQSPPPVAVVESPPLVPTPTTPTPTLPGVTNPPGGGGTPDPSPGTIDKSTARVDGSGDAGTVSNVLQLTGGSELANIREDATKIEGLKQAVLLSCNLDPSYTTINIEINIKNVFERPVPESTVKEWVVVCEYVLAPTPVCPIEVLVKEEINVYLFIRVQQPVIPWWKGPTATVCQCDEEGVCHPDTPPVPPPPVISDCSANICFLLDGSKSLINVDGWNDVVAAARSTMYSISSASAVFDVFWFSNEVERIGEGPVTGAQVAADNSFIRTMVNTEPNAHGTYMAQAISTCQEVLNGEEVGFGKTIVLITDGKPTDREATFLAADAVKGEGIKMVVVGAGDIDYETLKALATGPSFTFANSNLNTAELLLLADLASNSVCREED